MRRLASSSSKRIIYFDVIGNPTPIWPAHAITEVCIGYRTSLSGMRPRHVIWRRVPESCSGDGRRRGPNRSACVMQNLYADSMECQSHQSRFRPLCCPLIPFQVPVLLQLSNSLGQNPRHFGVGRCVLQKFTHPAYISLQLFSAFAESDEPTVVVITTTTKITLRILY